MMKKNKSLYCSRKLLMLVEKGMLKVCVKKAVNTTNTDHLCYQSDLEMALQYQMIRQVITGG